jgi:hypothetical protein
MRLRRVRWPPITISGRQLLWPRATPCSTSLNVARSRRDRIQRPRKVLTEASRDVRMETTNPRKGGRMFRGIRYPRPAVLRIRRLGRRRISIRSRLGRVRSPCHSGTRSRMCLSSSVQTRCRDLSRCDRRRRRCALSICSLCIRRRLLRSTSPPRTLNTRRRRLMRSRRMRSNKGPRSRSPRGRRGRKRNIRSSVDSLPKARIYWAVSTRMPTRLRTQRAGRFSPVATS